VAYHKPIPLDKDRSLLASGMGAWMEAEKLMHLAFILPASVLVFWGLGAWLDHLFHQKWIGILGIILGSVAGLTYVIQQAIAAEKKSAALDASDQNAPQQEEDTSRDPENRS
jgi:F0F1-type ATP synthase assembly protein I